MITSFRKAIKYLKTKFENKNLNKKRLKTYLYEESTTTIILSLLTEFVGPFRNKTLFFVVFSS